MTPVVLHLYKVIFVAEVIVFGVKSGIFYFKEKSFVIENWPIIQHRHGLRLVGSGDQLRSRQDTGRTRRGVLHDLLQCIDKLTPLTIGCWTNGFSNSFGFGNEVS